VAGGADDALQSVRIAALLFGGVAGRLHDPLDDLGVGQLDDDAVSDAAGDTKRTRPVAGDLHRDIRQLVADPFELELLVVPLDLPAVHQSLDHPKASLELR